MDKVSISYLFGFSRYQTKCVIKFLLRQFMTSWTILRFIFDHPLKQWPTGRKKGKDRNKKIEYLENEKRFLDEIKSIFHSLWRVIIWWKDKSLMKIADTSPNKIIVNDQILGKEIAVWTLWKQKEVVCRCNFLNFRILPAQKLYYSSAWILLFWLKHAS